MAAYTADHEGKVHIRHEAGETVLSFAITGIDGWVFRPGQTVEIADERIRSLITQLGAPFGIGQEEANDGSTD